MRTASLSRYTGRIFFLLGSFFICFFVAQVSSAQTSEIPAGTLSVWPAKVEAQANIGETVKTTFRVMNTTPVPLQLTIGFEDINPNDVESGDDNPATLLGEKNGAYPLRSLIRIADPSVTLLSGEEKNITVDIVVPRDARPGGRYGSAVVTAKPAIEFSGASTQNVSVGTRIAVLYFVRIPGQADESGVLEEFGLFNKRKVILSPTEENPLLLQVVFQNSGNVHLNPYGKITLSTWFAPPIVHILEPWAVYPKVTRLSEVAVARNLVPGYYRATLELNRGYGDVIDEREISFVVLPSARIIAIIGVLCVLGLFLFARSLRLSRNFTSS